ncbi:unnamed protein product [Amoebophrya sp. A25]|nr:unnamed protein product [Amoebophrya sp. A25]|eukprot:GSA25T00011665001.1
MEAAGETQHSVKMPGPLSRREQLRLWQEKKRNGGKAESIAGSGTDRDSGTSRADGTDRGGRSVGSKETPSPTAKETRGTNKENVRPPATLSQSPRRLVQNTARDQKESAPFGLSSGARRRTTIIVSGLAPPPALSGSAAGDAGPGRPEQSGSGTALAGPEKSAFVLREQVGSSTSNTATSLSQHRTVASTTSGSTARGDHKNVHPGGSCAQESTSTPSAIPVYTTRQAFRESGYVVSLPNSLQNSLIVEEGQHDTSLGHAFRGIGGKFDGQFLMGSSGSNKFLGHAGRRKTSQKSGATSESDGFQGPKRSNSAPRSSSATRNRDTTRGGTQSANDDSFSHSTSANAAGARASRALPSAMCPGESWSSKASSGTVPKSASAGAIGGVGIAKKGVGVPPAKARSVSSGALTGSVRARRRADGPTDRSRPTSLTASKVAARSGTTTRDTPRTAKSNGVFRKPNSSGGRAIGACSSSNVGPPAKRVDQQGSAYERSEQTVGLRGGAGRRAGKDVLPGRAGQEGQTATNSDGASTERVARVSNTHKLASPRRSTTPPGMTHRDEPDDAQREEELLPRFGVPSPNVSHVPASSAVPLSMSPSLPGLLPEGSSSPPEEGTYSGAAAGLGSNSGGRMRDSVASAATFGGSGGKSKNTFTIVGGPSSASEDAEKNAAAAGNERSPPLFSAAEQSSHNRKNQETTFNVGESRLAKPSLAPIGDDAFTGSDDFTAVHRDEETSGSLFVPRKSAVSFRSSGPPGEQKNESGPEQAAVSSVAKTATNDEVAFPQPWDAANNAARNHESHLRVFGKTSYRKTPHAKVDKPQARSRSPGVRRDHLASDTGAKRLASSREHEDNYVTGTVNEGARHATGPRREPTAENPTIQCRRGDHETGGFLTFRGRDIAQAERFTGEILRIPLYCSFGAVAVEELHSEVQGGAPRAPMGTPQPEHRRKLRRPMWTETMLYAVGEELECLAPAMLSDGSSPLVEEHKNFSSGVGGGLLPPRGSGSGVAPSGAKKASPPMEKVDARRFSFVSPDSEALARALSDDRESYLGRTETAKNVVEMGTGELQLRIAAPAGIDSSLQEQAARIQEMDANDHDLDAPLQGKKAPRASGSSVRSAEPAERCGLETPSAEPRSGDPKKSYPKWFKKTPTGGAATPKSTPPASARPRTFSADDSRIAPLASLGVTSKHGEVGATAKSYENAALLVSNENRVAAPPAPPSSSTSQSVTDTAAGATANVKTLDLLDEHKSPMNSLVEVTRSANALARPKRAASSDEERERATLEDLQRKVAARSNFLELKKTTSATPSTPSAPEANTTTTTRAAHPAAEGVAPRASSQQRERTGSIHRERSSSFEAARRRFEQAKGEGNEVERIGRRGELRGPAGSIVERTGLEHNVCDTSCSVLVSPGKPSLVQPGDAGGNKEGALGGTQAGTKAKPQQSRVDRAFAARDRAKALFEKSKINSKGPSSSAASVEIPSAGVASKESTGGMVNASMSSFSSVGASGMSASSSSSSCSVNFSSAKNGAGSSKVTVATRGVIKLTSSSNSTGSSSTTALFGGASGRLVSRHGGGGAVAADGARPQQSTSSGLFGHAEDAELESLNSRSETCRAASSRIDTEGGGKTATETEDAKGASSIIKACATSNGSKRKSSLLANAGATSSAQSLQDRNASPHERRRAREEDGTDPLALSQDTKKILRDLSRAKNERAVSSGIIKSKKYRMVDTVFTPEFEDFSPRISVGESGDSRLIEGRIRLHTPPLGSAVSPPFPRAGHGAHGDASLDSDSPGKMQFHQPQSRAVGGECNDMQSAPAEASSSSSSTHRGVKRTSTTGPSGVQSTSLAVDDRIASAAARASIALKSPSPLKLEGEQDLTGLLFRDEDDLNELSAAGGGRECANTGEEEEPPRLRWNHRSSMFEDLNRVHFGSAQGHETSDDKMIDKDHVVPKDHMIGRSASASSTPGAMSPVEHHGFFGDDRSGHYAASDHTFHSTSLANTTAGGFATTEGKTGMISSSSGSVEYSFNNGVNNNNNNSGGVITGGQSAAAASSSSATARMGGGPTTSNFATRCHNKTPKADKSGLMYKTPHSEEQHRTPIMNGKARDGRSVFLQAAQDGADDADQLFGDENRKILCSLAQQQPVSGGSSSNMSLSSAKLAADKNTGSSPKKIGGPSQSSSSQPSVGRNAKCGILSSSQGGSLGSQSDPPKPAASQGDVQPSIGPRGSSKDARLSGSPNCSRIEPHETFDMDSFVRSPRPKPATRSPFPRVHEPGKPVAQHNFNPMPRTPIASKSPFIKAEDIMPQSRRDSPQRQDIFSEERSPARGRGQQRGHPSPLQAMGSRRVTTSISPIRMKPISPCHVSPRGPLPMRTKSSADSLQAAAGGGSEKRGSVQKSVLSPLSNWSGSPDLEKNGSSVNREGDKVGLPTSNRSSGASGGGSSSLGQRQRDDGFLQHGNSQQQSASSSNPRTSSFSSHSENHRNLGSRGRAPLSSREIALFVEDFRRAVIEHPGHPIDEAWIQQEKNVDAEQILCQCADIEHFYFFDRRDIISKLIDYRPCQLCDIPEDSVLAL